MRDEAAPFFNGFMRPSVIFPFLLLVLLLGCGGGGPQVAPVTGTVTLDGRPLPNAEVMFVPEGGGRASTARTVDGGQYELLFKRGQNGALVGPHTVRIWVSHEVVRNPPKIAPRYDSESELRREVKAGEDNVFDFDVTTEAKSSSPEKSK
jgi:hypothetical protein